MTKRASLLFNSRAGQGDPLEELVTIRRILETKFDLDIYPINKEVEPADLAFTAMSKGSEAIIIAGGDGTISSVVEALVATGIPVGLIPKGTVNAFAKALNIPTKIELACETILSGKTHLVDTATCNGKPMVVLTGIGLEAETIAQTDRKLKKHFGILAFIFAGIKELRQLKTFEAWIETENETINSQVVAVTVANTAASTSLLAHGPDGVIIDDGLLEVTIFAPTNRTNAFFAAYHLLQSGFTGSATNRDDIKYLRAKYVKVRTEPPQKITLDGDSIEATDVEIKCVPKSLTVFVPT
jgi:YegS/Rv2252/BmrU family lipid kinase